MTNQVTLTVDMTDDGIKGAVDFLQRFGSGASVTHQTASPAPTATEQQTTAATVTEPANAAPTAGEATATSSAPAAPPAGNDEELDARGLPWDERLHSRNRTKNADQSWKYKRGLADEEKQTIEAELRARVAGLSEGSSMTHTPENANTAPAPEPAADAGAPPPPPAPAPEPPADVKYLYNGQQYSREDLAGWTDEQVATLEVVAEQPEAPTPPPAPAPATTGAPLNFAEAAQKVGALGLAADELNAKVNEAAVACGKPQINNFALLAVPDNADVLQQVIVNLGLQG